MNREIELFIQDYLKEIREDNAAIFAGAVRSVGNSGVQRVRRRVDFHNIAA